MRKYVGILIIILTAWMMASCSPIKTAPVKTYTLSNWKKVGSSFKAKTALTLLVSQPTAAPGYQTAAMIYVMSPYELESYANNRWVAPPAQMLMPMFVEAIRRTGYFYAVASPPFSGVTNLRVDIQVLKLQQEFLLPTSKLRLAVQASLLSNISNHVVASRRFEVVMKAPQNNAYSGVLAANRAAILISQKVAEFVVNSTKRLPAKQKNFPKTPPKMSTKSFNQHYVSKPLMPLKKLFPHPHSNIK